MFAFLHWIPRHSALAISAALIAACAPPATPSAPSSTNPQATGPRTLNIAIQAELPSLSAKALVAAGMADGMTYAAFNAGLVYQDEKNLYHPHLAQELPKLNTDTWKVNADGTMQVAFRLRPGLLFHDGTAVSARDWVLAFKVFTAPRWGNPSGPPCGTSGK